MLINFRGPAMPMHCPAAHPHPQISSTRKWREPAARPVFAAVLALKAPPPRLRPVHIICVVYESSCDGAMYVRAAYRPMSSNHFAVFSCTTLPASQGSHDEDYICAIYPPFGHKEYHSKVELYDQGVRISIADFRVVNRQHQR